MNKIHSNEDDINDFLIDKRDEWPIEEKTKLNFEVGAMKEWPGFGVMSKDIIEEEKSDDSNNEQN